MWCHGQVPQDLKDPSFAPLHERKGDQQLRDNPREIPLLNMARKIFACIPLNHLNDHLEQKLYPESQCRFRRDRGTIDRIVADCQLRGKCQGMRTNHYTTFVDFMEAFDTVNRHFRTNFHSIRDDNHFPTLVITLLMPRCRRLPRPQSSPPQPPR
ncbi:hypothetical protein SprV_0401670900 [Sparganum proliferum]